MSYYGKTKTSNPLLYVLGAVIVSLVVGAFVWLYGSQVGHEIWWAFRHIWPWATLALIIVGFTVFHALSKDNMVLGVIGSALTLAVVALGPALSGHYSMEKISHSNEITSTSPDDLSFRDRAPHAVASAVSSDTLGNVLGDATGTVKSIPAAGDTGEFTTSVVARGMFQGYEATQTITPPLFGGSTNKNVRFCEFSDDAKLRFGGAAPQNNLTRAIYWKTSPSTTLNRSDAFVVCDNDTPMVYAPLTKLKGFIAPHRVPAGVAIYNGKTGDLSIQENYEGPLPVYPASLAKTQRESTQHSSGVTDWLFSRAGYEPTGGDAYTEFDLASADGEKSLFLTPLKNRGDSSSIIALSTVESGAVKSGELNPLEVHEYPQGESRQSIGAVKAEITGNVLGGYKAQGLEVFEIIPRENGEWVASIGKSKSILYRATISSDGEIQLIEGEELTSDEEADTIGHTDKPLDQMTTEELSDLGKQIIDEIAKREG